MLVLKLAAVTCAFYLGAAVLIEVAMIVLTHLLGGLSVIATRPRLVGAVFFGGVWLASFLLAWRVVVTPIFARISK